uniref:Uncharacterized protein n=1 Tax=Hemiselmis andersenii TaxID=464988 RepID=A0A6U4Q0U5_HEMAN|mmetsp:Transcript_19027/g.43839  ORF Transcript_19027/g.43839 Transcript_19027/m.43839 type:complete len:129 (+) Transcript_19027:194-580(+)
MIAESIIAVGMLVTAAVAAVDGGYVASYVAADINRPEGQPSVFSRPWKRPEEPLTQQPSDGYEGTDEGDYHDDYQANYTLPDGARRVSIKESVFMVDGRYCTPEDLEGVQPARPEPTRALPANDSTLA